MSRAKPPFEGFYAASTHTRTTVRLAGVASDSWADQRAFGPDVESPGVTSYLAEQRDADPSLRLVFAGDVAWTAGDLLPVQIAVFVDDVGTRVVEGLDGTTKAAPSTVYVSGVPSGPALVLVRRVSNPSLDQAQPTLPDTVGIAVIAIPSVAVVTGVDTSAAEHPASLTTGHLWVAHWDDRGPGAPTVRVGSVTVQPQVMLPY